MEATGLFDEAACCKKSCFTQTNRPILLEKMQCLVNATNAERRSFLSGMLASDGKFYYDGRHVCSTFLLKAFNYSRDLQASVKKSPNMYVDRTKSERTANMRESIIDIIKRLAELTADKMPDKTEVHLPFSRKSDVFKLVISEYKDLYQDAPPTVSYISQTWKDYCSEVKVRKKSRFTICSICDEINTSLETALKNRIDTTEILERKRKNKDFITTERLEYRRKRNSAIREPSKYASCLLYTSPSPRDA